MAATEKQITQMGQDFERLERLLEKEQAAWATAREATEKRIRLANHLLGKRGPMIAKWEKTRAPRGSGQQGKLLAEATRVVARNWEYMVGSGYADRDLLYYIRTEGEQWEEDCLRNAATLAKFHELIKRTSQE